uniref:BCL2 associated X, apoptosis regulator a n=1 Tax=Maylandia zebra TaxID=106582 RepID=A0A3P9BWY1_9CICH
MLIYQHLSHLMSVYLCLSWNSGDQILEVGTILLQDFIYERVQRQRDGNSAVTREQLDGSQLTDPKHKKLAQCLQHIGDELDGNVELQRMINNSSLCPTRKVFMRVASEIFSDGIFNWGRVVALFYFACRLVIKVRETAIADSPFEWVLDFVRVLNFVRVLDFATV